MFCRESAVNKEMPRKVAEKSLMIPLLACNVKSGFLYWIALNHILVLFCRKGEFV